MKIAKKDDYHKCLTDILDIISHSRKFFLEKVQQMLVDMYWEIGYRIVIEEQKGDVRAGYGEELIPKLSQDLTASGERGFGITNIKCMRRFYLIYPQKKLLRAGITWTHYQKLIRLETDAQRRFYEDKIICELWSVRDLEHHIHTFLYERTIGNTQPRQIKSAKVDWSETTVEESIKDPYILDFLKLQEGNYLESDLEGSIISHIEEFLIELGSGFAFVARQKRIQIGEDYFYVDLVFFHRGMKGLVLIDLKIGKFTHADAGQMNMYLNYFNENERFPDENNPIGIILCADKNEETVRYALGGLNQKIFVSRYKTYLPSEDSLLMEVQKGRKSYENRCRQIPEAPNISGREEILKALVARKGRVSISDYMEEAQISRATAYRDLIDAVKQGWLEKQGRGRSTCYLLALQKGRTNRQ